MALQEEKQHIENADEDNVVTFTFSQKISSKLLVPHILQTLIFLLIFAKSS